MNNAESFVRILFHGLFIIARNNSPGGGNRPRWEVGLPEAVGHKFLIKLRRVNMVTGENEAVTDPSTPAVISILPDRPVSPEPFAVGSVDRLNDTGNVEHYDWLIDMEGRAFHNGPLNRRRGCDYKSRLHIAGGILYTYAKTVERYRRLLLPNVNVNYFGRFAAIAAIEIKRSAASSITINDGTATPQEENIRYELDCTYLPEMHHIVPSSHFPHYYNVLADRNDPDGIRYDVVHADLLTPPTTPFVDDHHMRIEGRVGEFAAERPVTLGVEPQVCNAVLLGQQEGGLP